MSPTPVAFWSTRAHPSPGTPRPPLHIIPRPLPYIILPPQEPPLQPVSPYHIPFPSIVARYPFQSRPTPPDGGKGMCLCSRLVIVLFPTLESAHLLPIQYSPRALSPVTLLSTGVNPRLCLFLEGPIAKSPKYQNSSLSATPKSLISVPFS